MSNLTKVGNRVYLQNVRGQGTARIWCEPAAGGRIGVRVQGARLTLMQTVDLLHMARVALAQLNNGSPVEYWQTLLAVLERTTSR